MCSIFGAALSNLRNEADRRDANAILNYIYYASHERGRDGRGYIVHSASRWFVHRDPKRLDGLPERQEFIEAGEGTVTVIGNIRAEPTTEYVKNKTVYDQQPYSVNGWTIAHNGTIANDKDLRTHQHPTAIDSAAIAEALSATNDFEWTIGKLKGSFAILATSGMDPGHLFAAVNYRPLWYAMTRHGFYFASSRDFFPDHLVPQMIPPYSMARITAMGIEIIPIREDEGEPPAKVLVICSGGLDSVVSAKWAVDRFGANRVTLAHFRYGSRAEGPEVRAIQAVAEALGTELAILPMAIYDPADSPLLRADSAIAGGEAGAEFAHEWVPARNLVMLALATAYAEARGYEMVILGNNLEEAGAYPDNEPEFIARFNDLLPFAIGDGKRLHVMMPVGNLMKHEIVKFGLDIGAPLHLTWSCYRAGEKHCGRCGPCFMRKTAFAINDAPEVIEYEVNE